MFEGVDDGNTQDNNSAVQSSSVVPSVAQNGQLIRKRGRPKKSVGQQPTPSAVKNKAKRPLQHISKRQLINVEEGDTVEQEPIPLRKTRRIEIESIDDQTPDDFLSEQSLSVTALDTAQSDRQLRKRCELEKTVDQSSSSASVVKNKIRRPLQSISSNMVIKKRRLIDTEDVENESIPLRKSRRIVLEEEAVSQDLDDFPSKQSSPVVPSVVQIGEVKRKPGRPKKTVNQPSKPASVNKAKVRRPLQQISNITNNTVKKRRLIDEEDSYEGDVTTVGKKTIPQRKKKRVDNLAI